MYNWHNVENRCTPQKINSILQELLISTIHTVGLCLLVFCLIPSIDPLSGVLFCNLFIYLPSLIRFMSILCSKKLVKGMFNNDQAFPVLFPSYTCICLFIYFDINGSWHLVLYLRRMLYFIQFYCVSFVWISIDNYKITIRIGFLEKNTYKKHPLQRTTCPKTHHRTHRIVQKL